MKHLILGNSWFDKEIQYGPSKHLCNHYSNSYFQHKNKAELKLKKKKNHQKKRERERGCCQNSARISQKWNHWNSAIASQKFKSMQILINAFIRKLGGQYTKAPISSSCWKSSQESNNWQSKLELQRITGFQKVNRRGLQSTDSSSPLKSCSIPSGSQLHLRCHASDSHFDHLLHLVFFCIKKD